MNLICKPTTIQWADPAIAWIATHVREPWLTPIVHFFSSLGETGAILLVVSLGYWLWNKRSLKYIAYGTFFAILLNVFIKGIFQQCRPDSSFWLDTTNELHKSFSFPSGHAQVSILFWCGLAYFLRFNKWLAYLCIIIGFMVGLARPYLGAHYLHDVFGGWLFGLMVLGLVILFERNERFVKNKIHVSLQTIGLLLFLGFSYYFLIDPSSLVLRTVSILFGFWLGCQIELRKVQFTVPHSNLIRIPVMVIGLAGILVLWQGVKLALSHLTLPAIQINILQSMQYALIGLWISVGVPLLICKFRKSPSRE